MGATDERLTRRLRPRLEEVPPRRACTTACATSSRPRSRACSAAPTSASCGRATSGPCATSRSRCCPARRSASSGPTARGNRRRSSCSRASTSPTRGYSNIRGRVGTLIEVSAGFHGDLTGRENVYLQGAIMGMRHERRRAPLRRDRRVLRDQRVHRHAGQALLERHERATRLRHRRALEPDVLIIDEVLAVGDMRFQERAFGRIRELARSGLPVVMVSHQLDRVAELCTDVIVLPLRRSRGTRRAW